MAVNGSLKDINLASLVQLNCGERNQARLVVRNEEKEAVLFFAEGDLMHVEMDSRQGKEVLYELLNWEEGVFELEQGVPPPRRTVTASWSALLLEGMRRIDESAPEWGENWDELEEAKDESVDRIARSLRRIKGVEGAVICSAEGAVLGQDTGADPARQSALTAFVGQQADILGALLKAGSFRRANLTGNKREMMIVACERGYIGLSLAHRANMDAISSAVSKTWRRYR